MTTNKILDLSRFTTTAAAAKALHAAVREAAEAMGQNPDIEVSLFSPGGSCGRQGRMSGA